MSKNGKTAPYLCTVARSCCLLCCCLSLVVGCVVVGCFSPHQYTKKRAVFGALLVVGGLYYSPSLLGLKMAFNSPYLLDVGILL